MRRGFCSAGLILALGGSASAANLSDLPAWARKESPPAYHALVVGLSDYDVARDLVTPAHDADLIAGKLESQGLGFGVTRIAATKLTRSQLIEKVRAFGDQVQPGDIALIYFSGHGVSRGGRDFLVPTEAGVAPPGREAFEYVSVDYVVGLLQEAGAAVAVVLLDACRTNPFSIEAKEPLVYLSRSAMAPAKLAATPAPPPPAAPPAAPAMAVTTSGFGDGLSSTAIPSTGVVIGYAAEVGKPAFSLFEKDKPADASIYTRYLTSELEDDDVSLYDVLAGTSVAVKADTDAAQVPWHEGGGTPAIVLRGGEKRQAKGLARWRHVVQLAVDQQAAQLQNFLIRFPDSRFAGTARRRLEALQAQAVAAQAFAPASQVLADARSAEDFQALSLKVAALEQLSSLQNSPGGPGKLMTDSSSVVGFEGTTDAYVASLAVAGVLRSPTLLPASAREFTAYASKDLAVNATARAGLGEKFGNFVSGPSVVAGEPVTVLKVFPSLSAAKIQTLNGQIGYIRGVQLKPAEPAALSTEYASEAEEPPFDRAQLDYLSLALKSPYTSIVVQVGPSRTTRAGEAGQLQFDRAMALTDEVVKLGGDRGRIRLDLTDKLSIDRAAIEVVR